MPAPEGPVSRLLRHRRLVAALAGAGASFAFAPYGWHFLAWLAPAVLFLLWEYESPREAAGTGFWFGAALFGAGTWWIYTAIHDFGQAPAWLALFLVAALLAIKGSYYALLGYLVVRIAPDPSPGRSLLLIPAGWTLMEWLRGWLFTGFPWLQLGYSQSDAPLAALATLELTSAERDAFRSIALVAPLKQSLASKKAAMERALAGYQSAAGYAVTEVTTAATFEMGELYRTLAADLMKSERPANLDAEELEQYDLLLEEQAFPFEEKAIELHETNARRAVTGIYDRWVQSSFGALARLRPVLCRIKPI